MLLKVTELNDKNQIKTIIQDPKLWELTYGQNESKDTFVVDETCFYLGIYYKKELAGIFQFKEFNKITLDGHVYLLPKYQNRRISIVAVEKAAKYLKENTGYYKVIVTTPLECEHVHKFLNKTDFTVCGAFHNSIIYNKKLQDLIIYELTIRG